MFLPQQSFDPAMYRSIMGHFATGVTVVTYMAEGEKSGMTANAFMSVSMDPPLAVVSVRTRARFATAVKKGDRFGVNFLLESQQHLSSHFGGRAIEDLQPPFEMFDGIPLLRDCLAQLVLGVVDVHGAGDHLLYIGRVEHMSLGIERKPLIFYSGAYKQVNMYTPPELAWSGDDGW